MIPCRSSAEESDIEGMEVIGEDGESVEDEDVDTLGDVDVKEEEEEEDICQTETIDSPEQGRNTN